MLFFKKKTSYKIQSWAIKTTPYKVCYLTDAGLLDSPTEKYFNRLKFDSCKRVNVNEILRNTKKQLYVNTY